MAGQLTLALTVACPLQVLCYIRARFIEGLFFAMADHDSHFVPGSMDISAHKRGYAAFLTGVRWTAGFILLIMIFLAFFRTHNG
jgi:hypothetical protein